MDNVFQLTKGRGRIRQMIRFVWRQGNRRKHLRQHISEVIWRRLFDNEPSRDRRIFLESQFRKYLQHENGTKFCFVIVVFDILASCLCSFRIWKLSCFSPSSFAAMFLALRMWDERVAGWNVVRVIETKPLDPAAFNKCFQRFRRKCYCDHACVLELRHEIAQVVDFRPGGGVTLSLIGVHVFASSFAQNQRNMQWTQRWSSPMATARSCQTISTFFFPRSFLLLQVSTVAPNPPRRNPRWRNPTKKIQKGKSIKKGQVMAQSTGGSGSLRVLGWKISKERAGVFPWVPCWFLLPIPHGPTKSMSSRSSAGPMQALKSSPNNGVLPSRFTFANKSCKVGCTSSTSSGQGQAWALTAWNEIFLNIGQQTPRHTNANPTVVSAAGQKQSVSTRHFNNLFLSISSCFGEQSNIEIICVNFSQKICELFGATDALQILRQNVQINEFSTLFHIIRRMTGRVSIPIFRGQVFVSAVPAPSLPQTRSWHHVHPGSPNPPSTKLPHDHHWHKPMAPTFHPHGRWSWKLCSWRSHPSEQNQPVQSFFQFACKISGFDWSCDAHNCSILFHTIPKMHLCIDLLWFAV